MTDQAALMQLTHNLPAEARFRMLVEQIPAVTYVAGFSAEAPFLYVSPQIGELLGFPAERWIADQDLWLARVHPEDRERVIAHELRTHRDVEPYEGEFRMIHRDGRVVWIWERDQVIRDAGGRPTCTQGVLIDVTELKEVQGALASSQAELREERNRAQGYLTAAATMMVVLDASAKVTLLNPRACEVLGYAEHELVGRDWLDTVIPQTDRAATRATFEQLMTGEIEYVEEFENLVVSKTGQERLIDWHNTLVRDGPGGAITGTLSSGNDITERRAAEARVAYLAYHDPVTGLGNREKMVEALPRAVTEARRNGWAASLLCIDIKDFKLVNDSLGHGVGDELLVSVARRLNAAKRHNDTLARSGGDEFLFLVPDLPGDSEEAASAVARRLAATFREPFEIAGAELHIGASIGVSVFPADASGADDLMRHADAANNQGKRAGGTGIAFYEREEESSLERLSLTSRLRNALDRQQLELHYQPIFSLASGRPTGVEALLRWDDPELGPVSPAAFIPVAEHSGLIEPLGEWVVEACCRQAAVWQALGLTPRMFVNASPRELRRPEYVAAVAASLRHHSVEPSTLIVEITESAAMQKCSGESPLDRLRELGVGLAIDDFGEGFSSLSRLREMPVDLLKVDRCFLRDVPHSGEASALITAIVRLAGALGRQVVAEGIETDEQRQYLCDLGCPLGQGFHLARPMPAAEVTKLLLRS